MPVKTRQKMQAPLPFKCRKTRSSSKTVKRTSMEKCSVNDSVMPTDRTTLPSSPRKRALLQEVSTNDERALTPSCSPRKMKKENIPIKEDALTSTDAAVVCHSPRSKRCSQLTSRGNISKALINSPEVQRVRASPKKTVCKVSENPTSPESKRKESPAKLSVSLSPAAMRQSPSKAVTPLTLERAEGKCYKKTKQALHTALPDHLLCRDNELEMMTSFLKRHLTKAQAGSLYISGAPGTGKTACLSQVLSSQKKLMSKAHVLFVNCMSVRHSQGIYGKILEEVSGSQRGNISAKDASRKLQKAFTSAGPMVVLVLDEIDHLDSKGQEVLYTMFEWPSLPKSRLILIGVANALDLTDRILPRLQARPKCKPELLHFSPYSKDQIYTILLDRVQNSCEDSVVEPVALQLCARKVAAVAGDIRKALDVCRRAVEIVECDVKSQMRFGHRTPVKHRGSSPCIAANNQPDLKTVGVKQVSSVISEVYGSCLTSNSNQSQTFPLQQKLMICTVLLMVRGGRLKEVTLGKCHETYSKVCKERRVPAVEQSEFLSLCQLVESRGLIGLKYAKDTRQTKICLKLNETEVETTLQDKVLLSSILQGHVQTKK